MIDILWPTACAACGEAGAALCRACAAGVALERLSDADLDVYAVAAYRGPLGSVLRRAKYGPDRRLATLLGGVLASRAAPLAGTADRVVPVPSPWTRRFARGFSTGAILAAAVSGIVRAPVADVLALRPGTKQAALGADERRANLAGRVSCRPIGGRVLLVDDAITTGSTARACRDALLDAGAARVTVLCLLAA